MLYEAYLYLHIIGVIVLYAGFINAFISARFADRSQDPRLIHQAFRTINFVDRVLTPLASFLLVGGGIALAITAGLPIIRTGWIFWSLNLLGLAGLIFFLRAMPLQKRIEHMSAPARGNFDWPVYERASRQWLLWAAIAFLAINAAVALMVFKPENL